MVTKGVIAMLQNVGMHRKAKGNVALRTVRFSHSSAGMDTMNQSQASLTQFKSTKTTPALTALDNLRQQVRAIETQNVLEVTDRVLNNAPVIDRILPQRGYRRGTMVDWIAPAGCAADFLSLAVAKDACKNGGALVVVDPDRQFFPAAAAAMGINIDQIIVLRSSAGQRSVGSNRDSNSDSDWLWAIDQALRCPAVAAVWGPLPKIDDRWLRRFQLSAESSGCMGLFIRPLAVARQPSWAEVQWLVSPARAAESASLNKHDDANAFHIRLQMTRCRGSHCGPSVLLAINTVTGSVKKTHRNYEHQQFNGGNKRRQQHSQTSARSVG